LGNIEGSSLTGDVYRKVRFFVRDLVFGFFGAPSDVYKKALETGISLHRDPVGGHGGELLYRGLRDTVKEGSGNGEFLSMEAL
jgi:hypothetical protein